MCGFIRSCSRYLQRGKRPRRLGRRGGGRRRSPRRRPAAPTRPPRTARTPPSSPLQDGKRSAVERAMNLRAKRSGLLGIGMPGDRAHVPGWARRRRSTARSLTASSRARCRGGGKHAERKKPRKASGVTERARHSRAPSTTRSMRWMVTASNMNSSSLCNPRTHANRHLIDN